MIQVAWPVEVTSSDAAGTECVTVPVESWLACVTAARDAGFTFFDWLSAVDQLDADPEGDEAPGVDVVAHLVAIGPPLRRLLLQARVPLRGDDGSLGEIDSLTGIFPGAAWHERETWEMFGVGFTGFDDGSGAALRPLLLPDGFEGTPLRKSFQLAARAARPWPGAKEPEEHGAAAPRRKVVSPAVPDPVTWGPRDA